MHLKFAVSALLALLTSSAFAAEVIHENTLSKDCNRRSEVGDTISVHYSGTLASDGIKFDSSYDRGQPLDFKVGKGMVIKGWDEGLLGMCPGDKRKLTIPPEFGYGDRDMGPIKGGSTLIFETELVAIKNVKDEL